MKTLLFISLFISCTAFALSQEEQDRFYWPRWQLQNDPLRVVVADQVANYMPAEILNNVFLQWNNTATDFDFFSTPIETTVNIDSSKLADYRNDPSFGIYHVTNWPQLLGENTIAVTANYYNTNGIIRDGIKYFQLTHSDVLINFKNFVFSSTAQAHGFDLPSVIIHELGHIIGMNHAPYEFPDSVMRRTATETDIFRNLTTYDVTTVQNFYEREIPQDVIASEGKELLIIHRLLANGTSTIELR
jgi:hypothetical protein